MGLATFETAILVATGTVVEVEVLVASLALTTVTRVEAGAVALETATEEETAVLVATMVAVEVATLEVASTVLVEEMVVLFRLRGPSMAGGGTIPSASRFSTGAAKPTAPRVRRAMTILVAYMVIEVGCWWKVGVVVCSLRWLEVWRDSKEWSLIGSLIVGFKGRTTEVRRDCLARRLNERMMLDTDFHLRAVATLLSWSSEAMKLSFKSPVGIWTCTRLADDSITLVRGAWRGPSFPIQGNRGMFSCRSLPF